jgi:hypothetical protein
MVLPVAALTWRAVGEARFAKGYQTKNVMRQIMVSLASAVGAVALQNGRVAAYSDLTSQAHQAAVVEIGTQAMLIASQHLYRWVAVIAIAAAVVVVLQKQLR